MGANGRRLARFAVPAALLAAAVPAGAFGSADNNGPRLTSATQAPWSVAIYQEPAGSTTFGFACSGTLISPTAVVTAAHCVYDANGQLLAPDRLSVVAGALSATVPDTNQQGRVATSLRVHPGYRTAGAGGDDLAILGFSTPFATSGAYVRPVDGIATKPASPGDALTLYGFGRQSVADWDAYQHSLGFVVAQQWQCPGEVESGVASFLCVKAASGTLCFGDSGGGLVSTDGGKVTLVAVAESIVFPRAEGACGPHTQDVVTQLVPPEVSSWLGGDDHPTLAPQETDAPVLADLRVDVVCEAHWAGRPGVTWRFIDTATGRVLQAGASARYVYKRRDTGRKIVCVSTAAADGLTTQAWPDTVAEPRTIAPRLELQLSGSSVAAIVTGPGGQTFDSLDPAFHVPFTLRIATPGGKVVRRLSGRDRGSPAGESLPAGRYRVCMSSPATGIVLAASKCVSWARHGNALALVHARTAYEQGRWVFTIRAAPEEVGASVLLRWEIRNRQVCSAPFALAVEEHATLGRTTVLTSPPAPRTGLVSLAFGVPGRAVHGVRYDAGFFSRSAPKACAAP